MTVSTDKDNKNIKAVKGLKPKAVVFDLDGTIYFGSKLADRANEVIQKAREICGGNIFFLTNNSAKTRKEIWQKLVALGIDVQLTEVGNSAYALAQYLKHNNYKEIYCIGTKSLKEEISSLGIEVNSKKPQAVVVGYNKDFTLNDLNELPNLHLKDYTLIVANRERAYPTDGGHLLPGAGPIVSAVEFLLNKQADVIIGKPKPEMLHALVGKLGIPASDIWVVGDSLVSDIQMAKEYGACGVWLSDEKHHLPDIQITNLADLLEIFCD